MIVMDQITNFFVNFWINYGFSVVMSIVFIICGFIALKILKFVVLKSLKRVNIKDRFVLNVVKKMLRIGVWGLVSVLILRSFNISISSIMVAVAPLFLTLGFGLKNFIANFIKGIQLKILNPYAVGDVIEVDGIRGKVEQIDFLYTYLHTQDGGFTTIANSQIADKRISNFTKAASLMENFNFETYRKEANAKLEGSVKKVAEEATHASKMLNDEAKAAKSSNAVVDKLVDLSMEKVNSDKKNN